MEKVFHFPMQFFFSSSWKKFFILRRKQKFLDFPFMLAASADEIEFSIKNEGEV